MTLPDPEEIKFVAGPDEAGKRLDQLVASLTGGYSRNAAAHLIRCGKVRVNDALKKPAYKISPGDTVTAVAEAPRQDPEFIPEPAEIDVVYKDAAIIVINKPPGMVVHPGAGHYAGTLAHALLYHFPEIKNVGAEQTRPGIIHRLDKDTSGVLIAARTHEAYRNLTRQFKHRGVKKKYIAFVHGNPDSESGQILLPIYRHPVHRKKMAAGKRSDSGRERPAETHWRIIERFDRVCMIECDIKTGRTHQIRVHLSAIGHPVIADPVYGYRHPQRLYGSRSALARIIGQISRQMLHAGTITFNHPENENLVSYTAPLPGDMKSLREALEETI